jgi:hypothetical protein
MSLSADLEPEMLSESLARGFGVDVVSQPASHNRHAAAHATRPTLTRINTLRTDRS